MLTLKNHPVTADEKSEESTTLFKPADLKRSQSIIEKPAKPYDIKKLLKLGREEANTTPKAVPWNKYTHRINYSSCNEDTTSEIEALQPCPGKRIICITAGGGRVINLLLGQPEEIHAVDLNPCQNFLLELKLSAMRQLDFDDFIAFMGVEAASDRLDTYRKLSVALTPEARKFFDSIPGHIEKGILFQGNMERFLVRVSKILKFFGSKQIAALFAFDDIEEQRRFISRRMDTVIGRMLLNTICRRPVLKVFMDDPGFMHFMPKEVRVQDCVYNCVHRYMWNNLAKEGHVLALTLSGKYLSEACRPLYLQRVHYTQIKKALDHTQIKITTSTISDYLSSTSSGSFDGYSLSDISSYLSDADYHVLLQNVIRTSRPGARLCSRQVFYHRELPYDLSPNIKRNLKLEETLATHDHVMIHEFLVGEITHEPGDTIHS